MFFISKIKKNIYKHLLVQLRLYMYIKLAQILSVDMKNLDGGRGSAPDPARGAHDAPHRPPSRIQTSRISVIKLWSPYTCDLSVTSPTP